jgi:hypothetical protein
MGSRAERRLGHADHRDGKLGVSMGAQAGPAVRVQIDVAIDDQQSQAADARQNRAQRRQLPPVELPGPVWLGLGHHRAALGQHVCEGGIGGQHGGRPGATRA